MKVSQLALVAIKRVLIVCVVLLILFSTAALGDDFFQVNFDICNEVAHSVEVYDIVKGYNNGYVTKEKALELLNGGRNLAFEKWTYWCILSVEESLLLRSLDEVVADFFAARIGAISYAIYIIEEGKVEPSMTSSAELVAMSGLNLSQSSALVTVQNELTKLGWE